MLPYWLIIALEALIGLMIVAQAQRYIFVVGRFRCGFSTARSRGGSVGRLSDIESNVTRFLTEDVSRQSLSIKAQNNRIAFEILRDESDRFAIVEGNGLEHQRAIRTFFALRGMSPTTEDSPTGTWAYFEFVLPPVEPAEIANLCRRYLVEVENLGPHDKLTFELL